VPNIVLLIDPIAFISPRFKFSVWYTSYSSFHQ